jgi:hypothetical protein
MYVYFQTLISGAFLFLRKNKWNTRSSSGFYFLDHVGQTKEGRCFSAWRRKTSPASYQGMQLHFGFWLDLLLTVSLFIFVLG